MKSAVALRESLPLFAVWKGSVAGTLSICVDNVELWRMLRLLTVSTHLLKTVSCLMSTLESTLLLSRISNKPPDREQRIMIKSQTLKCGEEYLFNGLD